jgi:hypothetical protein
MVAQAVKCINMTMRMNGIAVYPLWGGRTWGGVRTEPIADVLMST